MSSSATDIVKAYFGTWSLMSADKAALFLADDFQMIGWGQHPLNKAGWVRWMNALKQAVPDLKIKLSEIQTQGNEVRLTHYGVGTHRGPLDLTELDLPTLPATGKTVVFPVAQWELTVVEGKITQEELLTPSSPDSGLAGILKAFRG
jgi:hypothetical protein